MVNKAPPTTCNSNAVGRALLFTHSHCPSRTKPWMLPGRHCFPTPQTAGPIGVWSVNHRGRMKVPKMHFNRSKLVIARSGCRDLIDQNNESVRSKIMYRYSLGDSAVLCQNLANDYKGRNTLEWRACSGTAAVCSPFSWLAKVRVHVGAVT